MLKKIAGRLSYANVVATLALFLALGGGAWAISQNSVGTRQIKPNAVRSTDVKNQNLRSIDVAPNSLTGADIRENTLGAVTGLTSIWCGGWGSQPGAPCVGNLEINSNSPKRVFTTCELKGKQILTYNASVFGETPESHPNVVVTNVYVTHVITGDWVTADAHEISPTDDKWALGLRVWCVDSHGN